VWGDVSSTREFLFAADSDEGVSQATERYDRSDPVKLESALEITIKDLVQLIARTQDFAAASLATRTGPTDNPGRNSTPTARKPRSESRTTFEDWLKKTADRYIAERVHVLGAEAAP
jgi:hypothetical protein